MKPVKIVFAFLLIFSGTLHAAELKIGLIPEQNVFKQMKRYKPLGNYLEEKTGNKIHFTVLSRYGNIINSFHKKQLDGAFWGSFTGAMAIKKLGVEPIARPVNRDGTSTYHGYILVRKDSGITSVADMRGKVIAFVEKATTAGYIFPVSYFKNHNVENMDTYFKEYYFTGSHDSAIHSVLEKEADIACAKNTVYEMLARDDKRIDQELVKVARSPDVPSNGLGLKRGLAAQIKADIQRALLDMHKDPEGRSVLEEFGITRFIITTEADYTPVFEIAENAGILLKDYEYINE